MVAIEELKAQKAEIEKKRAAKLAERIEARDRKQLEEEIKVAEFEDKLGVLGVDLDAVFCPVSGRAIVVRRPSQGEWETFSEKITVQSGEEIVRQCRVYPGAVEYQSIIEGQPALGGRVLNAIASLAGVGAGALGKR